jgi:hypothetical protein
VRRKIHLDTETINSGDGKFPQKYDEWKFRIGMRSSYRIVYGLPWREVVRYAVLLVKPRTISSIYEEVTPTQPATRGNAFVRGF